MLARKRKTANGRENGRTNSQHPNPMSRENKCNIQTPFVHELLLPMPSAGLVRQTLSPDVSLAKLADHSIDILIADWQADSASQLPLLYDKLNSGGVLCLSYSSRSRKKTHALLQKCSRQLSEQKFSLTTPYTALPGLDAPKLVIPLEHQSSAFALRLTLNYRHPTLHGLACFCAEWTPLLFFIQRRMNNFTIIAQK